jgi:hypothetical protein
MCLYLFHIRSDSSVTLCLVAHSHICRMIEAMRIRAKRRATAAGENVAAAAAPPSNNGNDVARKSVAFSGVPQPSCAHFAARANRGGGRRNYASLLVAKFTLTESNDFFPAPGTPAGPSTR